MFICPCSTPKQGFFVDVLPAEFFDGWRLLSVDYIYPHFCWLMNPMKITSNVTLLLVKQQETLHMVYTTHLIIDIIVNLWNWPTHFPTFLRRFRNFIPPTVVFCHQRHRCHRLRLWRMPSPNMVSNIPRYIGCRPWKAHGCGDIGLKKTGASYMYNVD